MRRTRSSRNKSTCAPENDEVQSKTGRCLFVVMVKVSHCDYVTCVPGTCPGDVTYNQKNHVSMGQADFAVVANIVAMIIVLT